MNKECNVVMLPTKKASSIWITPSNILINGFISKASTNQHLYITSDEEIKEGDYYTDGKFVELCNNCPRQTNMYAVKKIIATTDTSLNLIDLSNFGENYKSIPFPQIPQSFIQQFITEYNKGNVITKVNVEYDDLIEQFQESVDNLRDNCLEDFENEEESPYYNLLEQSIQELNNYKPTLKVNQSNEITIQPIKDTYSRKEVIKLINHFENRNRGNSPFQSTWKWIQENL